MAELDSKGLYGQASKAVDNWLELHKGETFDLDMICRQLEIRDSGKRNLITIKLAYEVKRGNLKKSNRLYRYIDSTYTLMDWVHALEQATIDITWPYDHENTDTFGFDGHVVISPGQVIILAGVSNTGKTAFAHNVVWDNMDKYQCTLIGNEYTPANFKRRVSRMTWADPLKEDGSPKFELIERYDNWEDIIRPDNLNVIDWITVGDNFYKIGQVIEGIKSKLRGGIALICLQKSGGKELGEGGSFSERLSSLYLIMDFGKLTVRKAKEWNGKNPNGKIYGFEIIEGGTQFHNIREIKKCGKCWGSGKSHGSDCDKCNASGYIDVKGG